MDWETPKVYAVKHKNMDIRMASRSGGVFTALSDEILVDNGVVYGCVLTDDFMAVHIRAVNAAERNRMRGSKYIQSGLGDIFKNVKADLETGQKVLFSGTSCQVSGLQSYLGKEYENLLCVDIVCHGVPSPKVWQAYINWQQEKNKGTCVEAEFRNKRIHGWAAHIETLRFKRDNGKKKVINSKVFKTLFFEHSILRPCCHQCPYKSITHPGDITIADYWGIDKAVPGFNDNKGVSLVLVNTKKGDMVFQMVKSSLECRESRIEDSMQPALNQPTEKSKNREAFWEDFSKNTFETIAKKYGGDSLKNRVKEKLRDVKIRIKKHKNKQP